MRRSSAARLLSGVSLVTITLTGCSVNVDPARVLTGALLSFDACDGVLSYLKGEALDRVGPYGFDDGMRRYAVDAATGGAVVPEASSGAVDAPGVPPTHSETNVQEAGVDEPDIVKTDGKLIVSVADGVLRVIDAATAAEVGSLEFRAPAASGTSPMWMGDAELLLAGDRALVLLHQPVGIVDAARPAPGWSTWQGTTLAMVDLADPTSPRQLARLELGGDLVSARLVDGVVRVAISTQPSIEFPWDDSLADDEPALTERNRAIIEESDLVDWLPSQRWTSGDSTQEQLLVPCDAISYPPEFSGFTSVSVLSLAMAGDLSEPDATGVLGTGDTVYASTDRFYVVSTGWSSMIMPGIAVPLPLLPSVVEPDQSVGQDLAGAAVPGGGRGSPVQVDEQHTSIHAFDITAPGPATYVGSGEVAGHLIGQYALSEWEGHLRVASTTGAMWGSTDQSRSRVTVLDESDEGLVEVGLVDGLGKGEQIHAVRFAGPTAYVVTFRQTDPLYVVDLSDPTAPVVRGELKINGYSAYLHPIDGSRMVGVGQDADSSGSQTGAQVSLFDVSDPAAPHRLSNLVVRNGWSEAEWDARAFLYWPPSGAIVVPMSTNDRSGALVLSVNGDSIDEIGWVTSSRTTLDLGTGAAVRRSLVIGDRLFTVWPDGIQANDLTTLDELSWVSFVQPQR